jgi:hypothetical protein
MKYNLICMSFDGDYIKDFTGSIEECQNVSGDMGSKWYFYPFHFIITDKGTVMETGCGLIDLKTKESFLSKLFKNRKIRTVQNVFKKLYKHCDLNDLSLDGYAYESLMIELNTNLLR